MPEFEGRLITHVTIRLLPDLIHVQPTDEGAQTIQQVGPGEASRPRPVAGVPQAGFQVAQADAGMVANVPPLQ